MPERFTRSDVGKMNFYHGNFNRCNGIPDSNGGMREASGIYDDSVMCTLMQLINDFTFVIGLHVINFQARILFS